MKKVSVIVPAYNAHAYLDRCLQSLVNQTLKDIEIIIINDASKDDTLDIAMKWKELFPEKLKVINSDINRKSGGARNLGFDIAEGEYIGSVDCDDYVTMNMFELLYQKAKEGDYDIVDCGFYNEQKDEAMLHTGDNVCGILDNEKRSIMIANGGYLVTKIFRNSLYNDPIIRMREDVECLEDCEILIYMLLKANTMGNVKSILYKYCYNKESASKKIMDTVPYFNSIYGAMEAIYEKCHNLDNYEGCRIAIESIVTRLYRDGIVRSLYDSNKDINIQSTKFNFVNAYNKSSIEVKDMLRRLAELKKKIIRIDYKDNFEVKKRITEYYINIMQECDRYFAEI